MEGPDEVERQLLARVDLLDQGPGLFWGGKRHHFLEDAGVGLRRVRDKESKPLGPGELVLAPLHIVG